MDSLLDLERTELESHLFTHLSEIERRDDHSDGTDEDVDIYQYQYNLLSKSGKNDKNKKRSAKRSATKTGPIIGQEIGNRSRARKPHEPEPFLSIDNMPRNKRQQLQPIDIEAARQVSFISNPNVPYNTPSRSTFRNTASRTSTAPTMSGASTEWNSLVPKRQRGSKTREATVPHVNLMVQAPFKHSVNNTPRIRRAPSPSNILREKTNLATYQVAKVIAKQKRPQANSGDPGRLVKAKLKPMNPVNVEGPRIEQCRGVQPESKTKDLSASNTVQRRRQIMYTLTRDIGTESNKSMILPERPHTVESVHQTSIASDLSEARILDLKDDLEEVERREQHRLEVDGTPRIPPNSEASVSEQRIKLENLPPRTPQSRENQSRNAKSEIDSITCASETNRRSVTTRESGPFSVGEVPDELRNDELISNPGQSDLNSIKSGRPSTAVDSEGRKVRFAIDDSHLPRSQSARATVHVTESDHVTDEKPHMTQSARDSEHVTKSDHVTEKCHVLKEETGVDEKPKDDIAQIKEEERPTVPVHNDESKPNNESKEQEIAEIYVDSSGTEKGENVDNQNNNNLEPPKPEVLKMKSGKFEFKKRRPKSAPVRKTRARSSTQRIRNKLGTWGDTMKPDTRNHSSLNICGKSTEVSNDLALIEYYGEESAAETTFQPGRTCGKAARPLSATSGNRVGLRKYSALLGKDSKPPRARPMSAQTYSSSSLYSDSLEGFEFESRCASMAEREQTIGVTNSSRAVVSPVITYQNPSRQRRRRRRQIAEGEKAQLCLSDLVQHARAQVCHMCGEGTLCYVNVDNGVVCDSCALEDTGSSGTDEEQIYSSRADDGLQDGSNADSASFNGNFDEERFQNLEDTLAQIQSEIGRCRNGRTPSPFTTPRFLEDVLNLENDLEPSENVKNFIENEATRKQFEIPDSADNFPSGILSSALIGPNQSAVSDPSSGKAEVKSEIAKDENEDCRALAIIEEEQTHRSDGTTEDRKEETVIDSHTMSAKSQEKLQIKARKTNIRPRSATGNEEPVCPYPPLCFRLNARPPPGHCFYFAYGIDMNPHRFATYVKRENVDRFWGLLFGFKLRFNKKGEDEEAGCFPNIEYSQTSSVEGAMYKIKSEEMSLVDQCMGFPQYVDKLVLPIWFMNSQDSPDEMGVAQYCVAAVTYISKKEWTASDSSDIANEYAVSQCIKSADLLSPAYKEYLISQIN